MDSGTRSAYWGDVVAVVERSRRRYERFDPETDDEMVPIRDGIGPIVDVHVRARRDDVLLTNVERSLLEGVLNDWLRAYATCLDRSVEYTYTIHDVTRLCAVHEDVSRAVETLVAPR